MSGWCDLCGEDSTTDTCWQCREDERRELALAVDAEQDDVEVLDDCG